MGVAAEALKEAAHLLVDHRVMNHAIVEVLLLRGGRQFAVEQQIASLEEVAVLGQVFDRIAAVEQDAFVAVDIGDLGFAAGGRGEAGIVGEDAGLAVKLADVQNLRTDCSVVERKRPVLVAKRQLAGLDVGAGFRVHDRILAGVAASTVRCTRPNGQNGCRPIGPALFGVAQPSVHCKKIGFYRATRQRGHGAVIRPRQPLPE